MKKITLITLLYLTFFMAGCKGEALTADTLTWVSDAPILFVDDFSSQTGGWLTYEDRLSFAGYDQRGFRLWVDLPNFMVMSVPGLNFKDTNIYAKAQKSAGPDDNLYGLLCRYQDKQNFYAFVISSDGYYGIYRKEAGIMSMMGATQMAFNEVIRRGSQPNQIMAACQGDQLALYVNDTKLLQVQDDTFAFGDVGLIAGSLSEPGTDILFDYIIVAKP